MSTDIHIQNFAKLLAGEMNCRKCGEPLKDDHRLDGEYCLNCDDINYHDIMRNVDILKQRLKDLDKR